MEKPPFEPEPPRGDTLTDYDEAHLVTYLRLLDAASEGVPVNLVAEVVFGLDAAAEPGLAARMVESHLARARWMASEGYRQLAHKKP